MITFKIYLDGEFKQKIKLLREVETLGRSRSATLRLTDSTISGTHAQIKRSAQGGVTIKDLGSSNGTFVNDVRIDIQVLKVSDRIRIGRIGLKVYGIDPPVTKKAARKSKKKKRETSTELSMGADYDSPTDVIPVIKKSDD